MRTRDEPCSDRQRLSALAWVLKTRVFFYFPRDPEFQCLAGTCCVYIHMHHSFKNGFFSGKMFPCLSKFGSETYGHSNTPWQITVLCHVLPCVSHPLGWLENGPYTPSCPARGGSTWGEATSMARSKTSLLFVLQDSSPSHSSVSTVESIFSAFQLLAHSPWVLASPSVRVMPHTRLD